MGEIIEQVSSPRFSKKRVDESAQKQAAVSHSTDSAVKIGDSSSAATGQARRLPPALIALAVAVGSRLMLLVAGVLGGWYVSALGIAGRLHSHTRWVPSFAVAHLLHGWADWDGRWFLLIARFGYGAHGSEAFYPLYPAFVRAALRLVGNPVLGGVLVSSLSFVAAAYLLYQLVATEFDPRTAVFVVVFISIAPTSFFFQAVYSESLFLLLVVASFRLSQKRHWLLAGAVGLLACLTRAAGVVLIIPLALQYLDSRDWRWRRVRADALGVVLPLGGIAVYALYLGRRFGDPLLMVHAERRWHRQLTDPFVTIWRGTVRGVKGIDYLATGRALTGPHQDLGLWTSLNPWGNGLALIALVVVVALIVAGWRRLPVAYTAFAVAMVAVPLLTPSAVRPLQSLPRFALVAFPLFVTLALVSERRTWLRWTIIAVSCGALLVLTGLFVTGSWVA